MPDAWDFSQKRRPAPPVNTQAETPVITYLLTALSVIITVAHFIGGHEAGSLLQQLGAFGSVPADEIHAGRYWGLVTPVFIHGDWLHLIFDMLWLVQLGRILEGTLNPLTFIAFVIGGAAVGSGCQLLISGETGIGMSGVVYAMFGLMWAGKGLYPIWGMIATRDNLFVLVGWGLLCIVGTHFGFLRIANGAHVGGFLFGLSVGYLFFSPRRRWIWAAPLALSLGLMVLGVALPGLWYVGL